jgi:voltage-dependent calcium channel L type alpha-1D
VTSFDNILKSVLNIFIIITLEGWTDTMYKIRSATGTVFYDIFFILVVIFGSFFVLNLMVAVQFSYLNA